MPPRTTKLTSAVEAYFANLRQILASGGATPELPFPKPLANLLDAVGAAQRHGVIWVPIREPHDSIRDEHFLNRENFAEIDHPELGRRFWDSGSPWVSEQLK